MKTIKFIPDVGKVHKSLDIVATHHASRFAIPYAESYCKGFGYDIGCGKREWCFPGAIPIDLTIGLTKIEQDIIFASIDRDKDGYANHLSTTPWNANKLPPIKTGVDYIFSSHCLEHLDNPYRVLKYWTTKLKTKGVLFLYLPSYDNVYWRPWHNTKHIHVMDPVVIKDCLTELGFIDIFVSGTDLNESFMVIAQKS